MLYKERYRPQFHFTAEKNWLNDPNGMVNYQGEYHLFFQHNPHGTEWANITWGHAVGPDMLHWTQLAHALYPDELGSIFSGSIVVDWRNTSGFQQGDEPPLVAAYTSAGEYAHPARLYTQSLAYSHDRGRTWQKYGENPVVPNLSGAKDRDPKLLWHEPTKQWVMVLYIDQPRSFEFLTSPDLKTWTSTGCSISAMYECPDLFELPVDGNPKNTRWILLEADGHYMLGDFDGKTFTPETRELPLDYGNNFYAAQTFNNMPAHDNRCIQMAWMNGGQYPDMPFNQQMTFPCELSLRTLPDGLRVCRQPIKELESLRVETFSVKQIALQPHDKNPFVGVSGTLFEIRLDIEIETAQKVGLQVYGQTICYDAGNQQLSVLGANAPCVLADNRLQLHILVDRTSIEVFSNNGEISMSSCFLPQTENTSIELYCQEGEAYIRTAEVYKLCSIWK
jgi:sucrose-6-phosphate hydrolase SacC (GH32 family)